MHLDNMQTAYIQLQILYCMVNAFRISEAYVSVVSGVEFIGEIVTKRNDNMMSTKVALD